MLALTFFLRPENGFESYALSVVPSEGGSSRMLELGLRDPAMFKEHGRTYLLYSIEGEKSIGITEFFPESQSLHSKEP